MAGRVFGFRPVSKHHDQTPDLDARFPENHSSLVGLRKNRQPSGFTPADQKVLPNSNGGGFEVAGAAKKDFFQFLIGAFRNLDFLPFGTSAGYQIVTFKGQGQGRRGWHRHLFCIHHFTSSEAKALHQSIGFFTRVSAATVVIPRD